MMKVSTFLIAVIYPIASGTTADGVLIDGNCSPIGSIPLVIFVLSFDVPLQILNFAAFYLPLRQKMVVHESIEKLSTVSLASLTTRTRTNSDTLNRAARKSFWLFLTTMVLMQLDLTSSILRLQHIGSETVMKLVRKVSYLGLNFCIFFNVSSKWGCKQTKSCRSQEIEEKEVAIELQDRRLLHQKSASKTLSVSKLTMTLEDSSNRLTTRSPKISNSTDPRSKPLLENSSLNT
jgi:hypothetical protein